VNNINTQTQENHMLDDLNRDVASSGGTWVKLNRVEHGTLTGIVVDVETRDKTFEGAVVLSRKTGKPRQERVFTLITELRDPDIDDDKGLRKFSANEGAYFAVLDALKTAKATAEIGDTLAIKVTKDPETSTSQADYAAKWTKGPGVPDWYEAPMPAQRIEDEVPF